MWNMTRVKRGVPVFAAILTLSAMAACDAKRDPVQARKELGQMNVQFDPGDFVQAAANNDKPVVELFLDAGMDVNEDWDGYTALVRASWRGHAEVVKLLLDKGADVNAKDGNGDTALVRASWRGHAEIVKMLKKAGAKE